MRTMQKPARLRPVCRSSLVVYLVLVSEDRHSRALDRSSSSSLLDNAHTGSLLHSRTSFFVIFLQILNQNQNFQMCTTVCILRQYNVSTAQDTYKTVYEHVHGIRQIVHIVHIVHVRSSHRTVQYTYIVVIVDIGQYSTRTQYTVVHVIY